MDEIGLHLFYFALNKAVGIRVPCSDPDSTIQALHRSKKGVDDPLLNSLKLVKQVNEVWIVHNKYFTGNKLDPEKIADAEKERQGIPKGNSQHLHGASGTNGDPVA